MRLPLLNIQCNFLLCNLVDIFGYSSYRISATTLLSALEVYGSGAVHKPDQDPAKLSVKKQVESDGNMNYPDPNHTHI